MFHFTYFATNEYVNLVPVGAHYVLEGHTLCLWWHTMCLWKNTVCQCVP
jgi:hypothetical protein